MCINTKVPLNRGSFKFVSRKNSDISKLFCKKLVEIVNLVLVNLSAISSVKDLQRYVVAVLVLFTIGSCQNSDSYSSDALFLKLSSDQTGIDFTNQVADREDFNIISYRNFYNGGGVAIGDLNNDGLADLFFTANMESNRLYFNEGSWRFRDGTASAGVAGTKAWSTGVSLADINADGWLDIYVCNSGDLEGRDRANELFINQRDGTFREEAHVYGLDDPGYSTHATFFDYDGDGDLDCYMLNNSIKRPDRVALYEKSREIRDTLGGDKLYRNDEGYFSDVSEEAGIYSSEIGFGLGVSVGDLNGDFWPDIYISNDFFERDYLYLNQQDGTFREALESSVQYTSLSSMGSDIGDLDNDGDQEVFTTDMLPGTNSRLKTMTDFEPYYVNDVKYQSNYGFQYVQNCLQVNLGDATFSEEAYISGVAATDWSWGALMFDFDLDGLRDIYVSNGILHDITDHDFRDFVSDRQNILNIIANAEDGNQKGVLDYLPSQPISNAAFMNRGHLNFENQSDVLGLGEPSFSNGSAYGDLDNDGDLDLVVNNINMTCFIYQNQATTHGNHFLKIRFKGNESNPFGVGAGVKVWTGSDMQQMELYPARGFQSSMEPALVFGLGQSEIIDSMLVVWPDGLSKKYGSVPADTIITLTQVDASDSYQRGGIAEIPLLEEVSGLVPEIRHMENDFNDFQYEVLLPHKLSNEGPKILKGDINKDQLEDFILLGAANDPDKVYVQTSAGTFRRTIQPQLDLDVSSESNCGALFDADNDNDLDLMIGVGGNEYQKGFASFAVRFYRNDGRGNFSKDVMGAPQAGGNLSCIRPADFDRDGDLDVFLGARVVPGNYGLMPRSFLLLNEGGAIWRDVTKELTGNLGMVTDAVWTDLNGDHYPELLAVGEWMPITIIHNDRGELVSRSVIPNSHGWWNCIEMADLDGDGDADFVIGNWGKNSKWQADSERPIKMYVKDFDSNQKSEFIIEWFAPEESRSYPFATKMDLTSQLPHLRKVALKYETYADLTYDQLFSQSERTGADEFVVHTLATSVLWQEDSLLQLQELPRSAQLAPVYASEIADLDSDGALDIVLMGNQYGLKPEIGRQDGHGTVLLGKEGLLEFLAANPHLSGLKVKGEVRDIATIEIEGEMIIIIGRNNDQVLFYKIRELEDS